MKVIAKNKISGRTAQAIVAAAGRSGMPILFKKDGRTINASSLLGVLSLVILPGDTVEVIGSENADVIKEITTLLQGE